MSISLKDWSEIFKNVLEGVAVLGAAIWTIFRFGIFRERFAKIEFNLDCQYIGSTPDGHIIELIAVIENKGLVRQYIKDWSFDILIFRETDRIDETDANVRNQVKFTKKFSQGKWITTPSTFIDAGIRQRYPYITSVSNDTKFITVYSGFTYPGTSDYHASQKTFAIEIISEQKNSSNSKQNIY